jgi:hypothetical protein
MVPGLLPWLAYVLCCMRVLVLSTATLPCIRQEGRITYREVRIWKDEKLRFANAQPGIPIAVLTEAMKGADIFIGLECRKCDHG